MNHIRFFLVCCFVFCNFNNLRAYTFTTDFENGIFWSSFPISMGQYAANSQEASMLEQIVQEAKQAWEDVLGTSNLWNFSTVKIGEAPIGSLVRWSDNFAEETGYDPLTVLAVTVRHNSGFVFEKVEIILNGGRGDLRKNVNGLLKKTIIHELGHTIGLGHTEEHGIMQPYIGSIAYPLRDDVDGALAVLDETNRRQEMILTDQDRQQVATCGTLESPDDKGGTSGFVYSWIIGFLFLFVSSRRREVTVKNSLELKSQ